MNSEKGISKRIKLNSYRGELTRKGRAEGEAAEFGGPERDPDQERLDTERVTRGI